MTRKDFQLIANTIASMDDMFDSGNLYDIAETFAIALKKENPRFDTAKFIAHSLATKSHREAIIAQLNA